VADRIIVVGMRAAASAALPAADLYVGGRRQLDDAGVDGLVIGGDVHAVLDAIDRKPGTVCVLASGDPGFFGIGRALAARFGGSALEVHPAPSSVSLAFARVGLPWDDAVVVSAHGRPLSDAVRAVASAGKAAVLVSPDSPPEALGKELIALGAGPADVVVCSRLGLADECVTRTDLDGLAGQSWDPLSVVLVLRDALLASGPVRAWGRPDGRFDHRAGMITKSSVRAVALGKLDLPASGVLWDVGAGSGSVGIEAALLAPGLRVFAVERSGEEVDRMSANARSLGAAVMAVHGEAPGVFADLPDPDRVFVGGGGLAVLRAAVARLRPGGSAVATFAALDRAAAAADLLGNLVQVATSRGERLPDGGWRLAADNPVFVVWGRGPSR
jgi:precorrin-6Y C5,15-methyltransferase (decarboxylating)